MPRKPKERKHKGVFEKTKGSNIWWIRFVDADGKRKARCIGTFGDAANAVDAEKVRIRRGHLTGGLPPRNSVKVSTLCDDALAYSEKNHRDTRNFAARLEVIRTSFGKRNADALTPNEVEGWLDAHSEWSPATRNRYRAVFSKVLKLALQNQKVTRNVARLVPQKSEPAGRLRFLSDVEEAALRKTVAGRQCFLLQLDIALNTGMRKSEQFGLTWDGVDFPQRQLHLSQTKNGSSRVIHLNTVALGALKALKAEHIQLKLPKDSTLFLNSNGTPIADPREWFTNACERAHVDGVTWHTLRHTFASRLVMAGVDLRTVQDLMGHKTMNMTIRYAHLSEKHKVNALELLAR